MLATVGLLLIGMIGTTLVGPHLIGRTAYSLPNDLWGTLVAAQRLLHLDLGGLYTQPTGLVTFPGAAVILAPAVAVADAAGFSLQHPGPHNPQPAAWLVAGPYMIVISAVALLAADALAERLSVSRPKRAFLAVASGAVLWNVSVQWGHPEDAVAVGLLLYAVLALSGARTSRAAWLAGAAVAVQPLVLLAFPVLVVAIEPKRLPGFAVRAAAPAVVLVAAAAAANWTATVHAITNQPNAPAVDHPTPWIYLAPHLSDGSVAAGPGRALAIVVACGCGLGAWHRWRTARLTVPWTAEILADVLWWVAAALALRSVFEPVMVSYYVWPPLAVALVAASGNWWRLVPTSATATMLTWLAQASWRNPWVWWTPVIAVLALTLAVARPARPAAQVLPEPGEEFVVDSAP